MSNAIKYTAMCNALLKQIMEDITSCNAVVVYSHAKIANTVTLALPARHFSFFLQNVQIIQKWAPGGQV